jgi:phage baseplate assembly protein W
VDTRDGSFIGTGWSFPPTFSRAAASVAMVSGETDIRQSLYVLFSTAPGERLMVPTYGSQIWTLVFRAVTTNLTTQLAEFVREAVLYWEPRVDVDDVTATPDATTAGLVLVTLSYTVRRTNTRNNLVYPFYIQEGTLAPGVP